MAVKIGLIGVGFMGKMHLSTYAKHAGAEVVAICDINPDINKADYLSGGGGNIELGDLGGFDYEALAKYASFDEFIKHEGIDVVDVCLPTYLHCEYTLKALAAGKHVFCEKPIALNTDDAEKMIAAAEENNRILCVGHCIRFWPEYAWLKEALDNKAFGAVKSATFRRVSSAPTWAWDNWLMDDPRSGGAALDLHIHDVDFINYLFGMPKDVISQGASVLSNSMDIITTQYIYDDVPVVSAVGSWGSPGAYPFEMAFTILCEKAAIEYSTSNDPMLAVYTADGSVEKPEVAAGDGYSREIDYYIDCFKNNRKPEVVTPKDARDAVEIVRKEMASVKG